MATSVDSKKVDATTEHDEVVEVTKTNGKADDVADNEDVDMNEAEEDLAKDSSPLPPTNGTPASKKAKTGSAKKKGSAIPEHKSKKLNKKKSRPFTNLNAQPGEYYFARMKGHPPWPSIICDEEMLPRSLIDTRPVTTKLPDGTYKKPEYADGGKRAYERTFPIMFLHTNEFAWMPNTELTPLDVESVTEPSEKGKSKLLLAAYEKAAEQNDLKHFKEMLVDHQKAIQEDQEAHAEKEAKKANKAKRKSTGIAAAPPVDAEDMDIDEEVATPKPKSKKRKKDLDDDDDDDAGNQKPAKTPKTGTKLKLSTPKTPATEPSTKKKATKPKPKLAVKATTSEDEAVVTPKVGQAPLTPAAAKDAKEKRVLYYRHKLQRGFLSRDTMPKEDEMKSMSDFLSELETFPDLEGSIIRATKIHKVLKAMLKLPSIPLDEEYQFKTRSIDLLAKWNEILSSEPLLAGPADDKADEVKPETTAATTNGTTRASKQQASKAAKKQAFKAESAEVEGADTSEEDPRGTEVDGEKDTGRDSGNTNKVAEPEKPSDEEESDELDVHSAPVEENKPSEEADEDSI